MGIGGRGVPIMKRFDAEEEAGDLMLALAVFQLIGERASFLKVARCDLELEGFLQNRFAIRIFVQRLAIILCGRLIVAQAAGDASGKIAAEQGIAVDDDIIMGVRRLVLEGPRRGGCRNSEDATEN
ncbi:MAG TPA: hypothetical protein VLA17_05835 [Candidatus Limnocylindria bacterium]|nr:hypothetical protein [Candidatus Limnocylindria bacterium]